MLLTLEWFARFSKALFRIAFYTTTCDVDFLVFQKRCFHYGKSIILRDGGLWSPLRVSRVALRKRCKVLLFRFWFLDFQTLVLLDSITSSFRFVFFAGCDLQKRCKVLHLSSVALRTRCKVLLFAFWRDVSHNWLVLKVVVSYCNLHINLRCRVSDFCRCPHQLLMSVLTLEWYACFLKIAVSKI